MKFAVIGTGNVAWHLLDVLVESGHQCAGIVPSSPHSKAQNFAAHFGIELLPTYTRIPDDTDVIFMAVPDARISMISQRISASALVVHTSGMTPIHAIEQPKRAVMWPLLSLTQGIRPPSDDWQWVIQSEDETILTSLKNWLPSGHRTIITSNDGVRQRMHLAAVFANNFVNHLYFLSEQLLPSTTESSFGLLLPLLKAHINKIEQSGPFDAQTGPARRGDSSTIAAHRQLLQNDPVLLALYNDFTQRIIQLYEHNKL
jgi:predicted short-subunit dehydrogenase-like oxidoreductase (DUF2520 family)